MGKRESTMRHQIHSFQRQTFGLSNFEHCWGSLAFYIRKSEAKWILYEQADWVAGKSYKSNSSFASEASNKYNKQKKSTVLHAIDEI